MEPTPVSTALLLDDHLYTLRALILPFSRSASHRCFQRHGIKRRPLSGKGQNPPTKKSKDYLIGYLHVDFAEVQTEEGRQCLFVTIDHPSKATFADPRATRIVVADFLRQKLIKLPHGAHTLLIDDGFQFGPQVPQLPFGSHSFDRFCREFNLKHRLTKPAPF